MTRYARSGNTQKHKKMPVDATPWGELSGTSISQNANAEMGIHRVKKKGLKTKLSSRDEADEPKNKKSLVKLTKKCRKLSLKGDTESETKSSVVPEFITKKLTNAVDAPLSKLHQKKVKKKLKKLQAMQSKVKANSSEKECDKLSEANTSSMPSVSIRNSSKVASDKPLSKMQLKKAKRKLKKLEALQLRFQSNSIAEEETAPSEAISSIPTLSVNNSSLISNKFLSKGQLKKAKKKQKLLKLKAMQSKMDVDSNEMIKTSHPSENTEDGVKKKSKKRKKKLKKLEGIAENKESVTETAGEKGKNSDFVAKKNMFLEKLRKAREKKNIPILPSQVERKLYNLKKILRGKGLPGDKIKEIMRKERRQQELAFRKKFSKPCFNCRQTGHLLVDCPLSAENSKQETGTCFKCGLTDHTSMTCDQKIVGYPLAKCFVCKEQGHISRDCPKNKRGIYIKGGKCSICGNVNHLRKDCPSLTTMKNVQEDTIAVHTISEGTSVDAEVVDKNPIQPKKLKKAKIVKF